jgi:hypothetical protein
VPASNRAPPSRPRSTVVVALLNWVCQPPSGAAIVGRLDHAAQRLRAEAQCLRTAVDLDLLDRQRIDRHAVVLAEVGHVHGADAVLLHAHAKIVEPAQHWAGRTRREAGGSCAGQGEEQVAEALRLGGLNLIVGDGVERRRGLERRRRDCRRLGGGRWRGRCCRRRRRSRRRRYRRPRRSSGLDLTRGPSSPRLHGYRRKRTGARLNRRGRRCGLRLRRFRRRWRRRLRRCFPNAAAADAFRHRFGGERLTYTRAKPRSLAPKRKSRRTYAPG